MTIALLNKSDLAIFNKRSLNYRLADAEKDYFLAIAINVIYESYLKDKLVFKGGTAIHHCYLPQTRLSEDLDFTSLDNSIELEEVKRILLSEDFFEIKKEYKSDATIKIERLKYTGPLVLANSIKVEIDFKQNVVLPAQNLEYKNAWGVEAKVKAMEIKEICAEKIRATSDRARYRDFYDLTLLFENYDFKLKEVTDLIRQKEIRKPISQQSILNNWDIAKKELESELGRIYYSGNVTNEKVESVIKKLKIDIKK